MPAGPASRPSRLQPTAERTESMASRRIAIVGGGPSGALCAERLASAGFPVTLFDEHLAWEKPCGGGLTHKALRSYPFLLNGPHPKKAIHRVELISAQRRSRRPESRPSDHDLLSRGPQWAVARTGGKRRMPHRPLSCQFGGHHREIAVLHCRKRHSSRGFPDPGLRCAQFILSCHCPASARGPGDDAWLLCSLLRGHNPCEILARPAGLYLVFPALRPSLGRNLWQLGPSYKPRAASASGSIHARGKHFH